MHAGGHRFESDILHRTEREREREKEEDYLKAFKSVCLVYHVAKRCDPFGGQNRFETGAIDSEAKMLKQCEA